MMNRYDIMDVLFTIVVILVFLATIVGLTGGIMHLVSFIKLLI